MKSILFAIFTLFLTTAAFAQTTWKSDVGHSRLGFKIGYFGTSDATGQFDKFDATAVAKKDDFSDMTLEVSIDASTINTYSEKRDKHLSGSDFVNASQFATITYKSTKVKATKDGKLTIQGDLTFLGKTIPVTLEATFKGTGADAWGNTRAGFHATGTFKRSEFGMSYGLDNGSLADEVILDIDVSMIKS